MREGEEGDMGEIKKVRGMGISARLFALNTEEEVDPGSLPTGTTYSIYDDKASVMRSSQHFTP